MSGKLKTMFRKQLSLSNGGIQTHKVQRSVSEIRASDGTVTLRSNNSDRRRQRSMLGVLEEMIVCPICKDVLKSPRMLECQHTFCKKCLEIKLKESLITEDCQKAALNCPLCSSITTINTSPDNLPINLSIERVLRAVDNGTFVGHDPNRPNSLMVNFAPLIGKKKEKEKPKCAKCQTVCLQEPTEDHLCYDQIFCQICQTEYIVHLKEQLKRTVEQLQNFITNVDRQVLEFKIKTDKLKDAIERDYEMKLAALLEEKKKKSAKVDEMWSKSEDSAKVIKKMMQQSLIELDKHKDCDGLDGDDVSDDHEKIKTYQSLCKKAKDIVSRASKWQSTLGGPYNTATTTMETTKGEEAATPKQRDRPKLLNLRKLEVKGPSSLALDPRRGDIYVACPNSNQVLVLDRLYRVALRIQHESMMAPQGVAFVESRQEICVTDKWRHAIFVYNRKGQLERMIGGDEKGSAPLRFHSPWGIGWLSSRDLLYVADTRNDRVQIIGAADGSYKGSIGPRTGDWTPGCSSELYEPTDVAVSDAAVVVADSGNHKIKIFNHRRQLLFSIGGFGVFKGLFRSPEVVKLDAEGNIYVGDSDNKRVQIFTSQGELLRVFGSQGSGLGHFAWISGLLCLPNSNDVLVADSISNTLQLF